VWIEGETPTSINVEPQISAWGHVEFFSGEKWLQVQCDAEKVEKEFPEEGALLAYDFQIGQAGQYEIWNRIGYEFVRSPFEWRLDGGEWTAVSPEELTTDLMEFNVWNELAWLKLGEEDLTAGGHKLEIRVPRTKDDQGRFARVLYASDALCLYRGRFHPNGKYKPDENYRDERDEEAARQVFRLGEEGTTGSGGERVSVSLAGLWEVCRHDEQWPGEVAAPIQDFPEEPHWKAIPVPGDKNTLRPDLEMAHRLWYRTRVYVPESLAGNSPDGLDYQRRSFHLVFPQNNLNTTVYVNGVYCGFNKNPFARFQIDVTKGVKPGVNEVWVGLRDAWYGYSTNPRDPLKLRQKWNLPVQFFHNGWQDLAYPIWNHPQSGILVTPEFVAAGPVYAADVFVKPSVARKELAAEVTLLNTTAKAVSGEVQWQAVNAQTGAVEKDFPAQRFTLAAGAEQTLELTGAWANPHLWWPDDPNLYHLRTTVVVEGKPVDVKDTTFGFREWSIDGKNFQLNGVTWHGWADCHTASNKEDWLAFYRRTNQTMMRFWGTSWQGMPPEEALDFFDRNGVVVRRSGLLDGEAIGYFAVENDPDLKELYGSEIKMELMNNWRDQILAQVKGERNHPSILIWSIENEWLYINCINLYGHLMDEFEAVVTEVSNAVRAVDPTRPTMVDGGGATKAQTLPVHGDHYVVGRPQEYPDLAYQANPTGGGRGRWVWDEQRPRFIGEDYYMTGNHPEVAYFEGEGAFAGKPRRGVALWNRILQEGYRWAEYGAWQFWLGQHDTDQSQYIAFSPRAVFCRQWDWTFAAGQPVKRTFGIFNDTHSDDPITFTWTLMLGDQKVATRTQEYHVPAGTNLKFDETIPLPTVHRREEGKLSLKLTVQGQEVFLDVKPVSVLKPRWPEEVGNWKWEIGNGKSDHEGPPVREGREIGHRPSAIGHRPSVAVFDPQGAVAAFLKRQSIPFTPVDSLDNLPEVRAIGHRPSAIGHRPSAIRQVLVVGPEALDERESTSSRLAAYAAAGGRRVIVLEQTHPLRYQGLPAEMEPAANEGRTAFGEDLDHPVLRGLKQKDFFTWGEDRLVYRHAYLKPTRGARSLVQCDDQLRYTALAEVPVDQGLLLLCQLRVGENLDTHPVAQQLLLNLLGYAASYRLEFHPVVAAIHDNPLLEKTLDAIGLQYTKVDGPLQALGEPGLKTALISASPANLKTLADHLPKVDAFTRNGGAILLCGLTPEGLADYNRIVGVDHLIRPFKRERVLFPPVRDRLTAGLTTGDVVLYSAERIFSWTAGNYVVSDLFSFVVDYDEVAAFGKSPFFAYDNITNGFVSADGWPLIINFPKNEDDSPYDVPITLPKPQTITEFTWIGNTFYWPQTRVNLIFDGKKEEMLSLKTEPNAEPQTFAIDPPRTAQEITLQIAEWIPRPGVAPNIGIDNIYLKAQRPPEFYQTVKPMLNVGGLMHYLKGSGHIVLCNLLFKENEDVPENADKKRHILATILRNLKAPFTGGKTIIAGANLEYHPIDLSQQANQYRDERGWFGDKAFTFKDLPPGDHSFAGVRYHVYEFPTSPVPTVVMLGGPGVPGNLPEEVRGIPVNRKADALFFLHTARLDARRNAQEVRENKKYEMARYVITYADGQTADVPIYAEIDIDHYRQQTPAALPGAQMAWVRPYGDTGFSAVAYSKQWNNPRPEVDIRSVDLVYGPDRRGVPVLLALTAATASK